MTDIQYSYSHAAILVSDIERSARFYERAVGWQHEFSREFDGVLGEANAYGGPGRIAMGNMGGVHLQLVQMEVPLETKGLQPHCGIFMCSVMVDDLEPVRERLRGADIPITRELDIGGVRLLVVTDPDGQELGIMAMRADA
ncbi:MAG: VOC family protein [Myxococcales bacterium]|nr:VOC family protein [Myxococcales bacterium]